MRKIVNIFIVIGFIVIGFFPFLARGFKIQEKPKLVLPEGKCIKSIDYMRRHHMELLNLARDNAIRKGERGSFTLTSCKSCHINRAEFCNRCHNFVGVKPLCFTCHYYPE